MRRMYFTAAVLAVVAGCAVGAPPGFSGGDRFTFPLIGPLEDGLLITPVTVRGHGPYLFAIDPDANVTAIDQQVVVDAALLVGTGPQRIDESETGQTRFYAELHDLKVAGLAIDRREVMVFPTGMYDTEGRHINGILGRDVIADSMVFGFDRDQGIATLSTVQAFQAPPEAIAIKYDVVSSRSSEFIASRAAVGPERAAGGPPGSLQSPQQLDRLERNDIERSKARARPKNLGSVTPVPRRLASASIGGSRFAMHLDLGAVTSQLPVSAWSRAQLAPAEAKLHLVDEATRRREVNQAGTASEVTLGSANAAQVAFVPFVDKRWNTEGVEGALGLDFFRPYAVYANWDKTTYYLRPRGEAAATIAARQGRWGTAVPACPHAGCITTELLTRGGGVAIHVVRDAEAANRPLEVFLGVTPAAGKSVTPLVVELPAGAKEMTTAIPPDYAGATLTVLDVSPFPRACAGDRGCVAWLGGPLTGTTELSPMTAEAARAAQAPAAPAPSATPAADPGPPRSVTIDNLRRVTGELTIAPSDEVKREARGKAIAVAIVKLCVSAEGTVVSTRVAKSSGVLAYDVQLQITIKETWTFEPTEVDGKPAPVCTTATFMAPGRGQGPGGR